MGLATLILQGERKFQKKEHEAEVNDDEEKRIKRAHF